MQLIQTVTAVVSDTVTLAPAKKPQEEFLFRFRVSCQLIDHYASVDDCDSGNHLLILSLSTIKF